MHRTNSIDVGRLFTSNVFLLVAQLADEPFHIYIYVGAISNVNNYTLTSQLLSGGNGEHNDCESSACVGLGNASKKSGSSGFLRSLLCCWGGGGGRGKGPPSTTVDGAPSSPLVLTSDPSRCLLPPVRHQDMHKKCMVIDLDETLVHSSFKVSFMNPNCFVHSLRYLNLH